VEYYQTIPTLRDYVILSHRERRITVYSRSDSGEWITRVAISGGRVFITSLRADLAVDEIYRKSAVR
jgi:Uma2 family endonuclease